MTTGTHLPATAGGSLIDWSLSGSLAVTFPKSRSANYDAAVNLAEQAEHYVVQQVGSSLFHLAGFGRSRDQAARALAVLQHLGGVKGFQVVAGGAVLQDRFQAARVLACYITATGCTDHRAHCTVMVERERLFDGRHLPATISVSITAGPARPASGIDLDWLGAIGQSAFPCRFLLERGFRLQKGHPSSEATQLQAAAVREGCDWCPNLQVSI